MKILLINSDIAKNRGDRAIAEGLIYLIRKKYPHAEVTGISEKHIRDKQWFNIDFLNADVYTLNPLKWLRLLIEAYRSDIIYWGGGEYLKDYTNKASLWYWLLKITLLRIVNSNIYGVFQGIGPTEAIQSQSLIVRIVNMTKKFVVRDQESYDKLVRWGVDNNKLVSSADPAIYPTLEMIDACEKKLHEAIGVQKADLSDFIAIAPRNWFHYKKGRILPQRFRRLFFSQESQSKENKRYIDSLVQLIEITSKHTKKIFLVPMHMSEDVEFCNVLKELSNLRNIHVLGDDNLSPFQIRSFLSRAKLMVGFRLHSNIIATSNYTPCINYYYVDKGRAYFDQIEQAEYCFPIEDLLNIDGISFYENTLNRLTGSLDINSTQLRKVMSNSRKRILSAFEKL